MKPRVYVFTILVSLLLGTGCADSFAASPLSLGQELVPEQPTGFHQARTELIASLAQLYLGWNSVQERPSAIRISPEGLVLSGQMWYSDWKGWELDSNGPFAFQYSEIKSIEGPVNSICAPVVHRYTTVYCNKGTPTYHEVIVKTTRNYCFVFASEDDARRLAGALRWLVSNGPQLEARQEESNEHFKTEVVKWQSAVVKPTMPDEAHVHQVLAENAVAEKNIDKAIDEYEAALEIFPTWPDGQNNLAYLCGESGDYDCAVEHAQDYLELVPNASDAQAVKDKIIIWKDKLTQSETPAASSSSR